jgi:hypothetical protein
MRLLVPAYGYPGTERALWDAIADAGPAVGHVIINPGSGPGRVRDPAWVSEVRRLDSLGIPMLGYLDLAYARKPLEVLVSEAATWRRWYGMLGYFLDCAPSRDVRHTGDVADLLRTSTGAAHLTANPGTRTTVEVARHFDGLVEHEGPPEAAAVLSRRPTDRSARIDAGPGRAWVVHGAGRESARRTVARARRCGVSELWVTDLTGANPYRALPTYWPWLLAAVESP